MPSKFYRAAGMSLLTNAVNYGADPTGVSDSLAAINEAINATIPGGTCVLPAGTYKIVQDSNTSLAQVIKLKAGVTLRGAGVGQTYIERTFQGAAVLSIIRAPEATVSGITFLNGGYRTGLTFPTAAAWRVASTTYNYGTYGYTGYDRYYEALLASTGLYLVPRDNDCAIFIGGSNNVTIQDCAFDSNYDDELGWWFNCIGIGANEDETKCNGLLVKDCTFSKCRFGVLSPGVDDSTFDGLTWLSNWSYAGAPPSHLIYISATPGAATTAEKYLCSNITIKNIVDTHVELPTVYSAPVDYYGDVTIKVRKCDGLVVQDCTCVSPSAGFNFYDIKDGSMSNCWFDASSCPDDPARAWGPTCFFMVDQTRSPATGYTAGDYILGPMDMDLVTFIGPPPGDYDDTWTCWWRSNPYKTSGGNAPASVGDTWTDVTLYLAPDPTNALAAAANVLVGSSGTYGTTDNPVRFLRHPDGTTWSDDQQLLYLDVNSASVAIAAEVDAPTGSFTSGHPPKMKSQSATSSTLNGSNFNSGTTTTFNNTSSTPDPQEPPIE